MREKLTTATELTGGVLLCTGMAMVWPPLGFIVGGALLISVGWLLSR
jgi:hypothetical protein